MVKDNTSPTLVSCFNAISTSQFSTLGLTTLQEEKFHCNLSFAISLMANTLILNSVFYYIFRKLSMVAHIHVFKIQKSKFANI